LEPSGAKTGALVGRGGFASSRGRGKLKKWGAAAFASTTGRLRAKGGGRGKTHRGGRAPPPPQEKGLDRKNPRGGPVGSERGDAHRVGSGPRLESR